MSKGLPAGPGTASPHDAEPRIHMAGLGGLLLDGGGAHFSLPLQRRVWALAESLRRAGLPGVREIVPGVNNLLLLFDPLRLAPAKARDRLLALWQDASSEGTDEGRLVEVPVTYGGASGEDLPDLARSQGLSIADYVELHTSIDYRVACVGSMPGFVYLAGLPLPMATPRRAVPRLRVPPGAVMIGGVQAGIMPMPAPSGWHVLGRTELQLFDPHREAPCLLLPGDRVRFTALEVQA
ncbi:5-oxoprolinase subunit PxpB [Comamonadaceae bacterium PP-2]